MKRTDPATILDFWYAPEMQQRWFASTPDLDRLIRERFSELWRCAANGEADHWLQTPEGALALAIVLDQFPLNMFRGTVQSYSTEAKAIAVARYAVSQGYHLQIDTQRLAFLFMPLMHSESLADQTLSVELFQRFGLPGNCRFAEHHRNLIRRFGRFPHRNAVLGRESTAEEQAYLASKEAFLG